MNEYNNLAETQQAVKIASLESQLREREESEKELSDAYLRIRTLVDAFDTKPGGVDRFEVTENKIRTLQAQVGRLREALRKIAQDRLMSDCQMSSSYGYDYEKIANKALTASDKIAKGGV